MSFLTQVFTDELVVITCANCQDKFGISKAYHTHLRESHGTFYCPRGHSQWFPGKSDTEKLKETISKLETREINLQAAIDRKDVRIEQLKYSVRAQKAAKTKIINRIKNGACPCCNRTFSDLQRHFKSKHPELFEFTTKP